MKLFFLFLLCLVSFSSFSDTEDEIPQIKKTVNHLFEGMRSGDSTLVRSIFRADAKLFTVGKKKGITEVKEQNLNDFISAVGTQHDKIWDEKLVSWDFTIDGDLAVVCTDYIFYHGYVFSHCGINVFQLVKSENDWKIFQITDTRRTDCMEDPATGTVLLQKPAEIRIGNLLDNWHRAAARGDLNFFSELMDPGFIYLGTDKAERWEKDSFVAFCKPYFEREEGGWNFKPVSRKIYFSDDLHFAWFEEHLNTWMGVCRGSGVLRYSSSGWKLMHYNLCMTIRNEDVNKVIDITDGNK